MKPINQAICHSIFDVCDDVLLTAYLREYLILYPKFLLPTDSMSLSRAVYESVSGTGRESALRWLAELSTFQDAWRRDPKFNACIVECDGVTDPYELFACIANSIPYGRLLAREELRHNVHLAKYPKMNLLSISDALFCRSSLFFCANSAECGLPLLDFTDERKYIDSACSRSDNVQVLIRFEELENASKIELRNSFKELRPRIVHFSGHCDKDSGSLYLNGNNSRLRADEFLAMISEFDLKVDGVILNACYSSRFAKQLIGKVGWVISVNDLYSNELAAVFSKFFYGEFSISYDPESAIAEAIANLSLTYTGSLSPDHIPSLIF